MTQICTVIYSRSPGQRTKLYSARTAPVVPRIGEWIGFEADGASFEVRDVEYDYTTDPVTVNIYVR